MRTDERGVSGGSAAGDGMDEERRPCSLKKVLEGLERDIILSALRESRGNKAKAARALGITERLMGLRVNRLGIDWRELRAHGKKTTDQTR